MKALLYYLSSNNEYNLGWFRLDEKLSKLSDIPLTSSPKYYIIKSSDNNILINYDLDVIYEFDDELKIIRSKKISYDDEYLMSYKYGDYFILFSPTTIRVFDLIDNSIIKIELDRYISNKNIIIDNDNILLLLSEKDDKYLTSTVILTAFNLANMKLLDYYPIYRNIFIETDSNLSYIYDYQNHRCYIYTSISLLDSILSINLKTYMIFSRYRDNNNLYIELSRNYLSNNLLDDQKDSIVEIDDYESHSKLYEFNRMIWMNINSKIMSFDYKLNKIVEYNYKVDIKRIIQIIKIVDEDYIIDYNINDDYRNVLDFF